MHPYQIFTSFSDTGGQSANRMPSGWFIRQ